MDIQPLQESPAFMRLWLGSSLSSIGSRMTTFAVALQVYYLTHSSLAVGGVGLAMAAPAIVLGLAGGTVADAVDRRKLVLVTTSGLAVISTLFAVQAFTNLGLVWLLYALVAVQSLLAAVDGPARRTFLPRLLPAENVSAGAALNMFAFHLSVTAGPALAGLITAGLGLRACYLVDAVSFSAALYGIARLPAMPPTGAAARPSLRAVADAIGFIRRSRILAGAFLADMNATILGMPFALFPAINADHFGGAAQTLGLLNSAPAVGGIIGSALSGPVGRVSHQGRAILIASAVWGAGLAAFGLANDLRLALGFLVLAGVADVLSVVFRTTIVQVTTPDNYRGRVSAAEYVVGVACPQLGNFRAGAVGSLTSATIGAVSGGLSTVVGAALIALLNPAMTGYRARTSGEPGSTDQADATETAG
jgi:MFS family permease